MPNEPRTPEEYIAQNYLRGSDRRLAARIGWTRTEVRAYRNAHGLARPDEDVAWADPGDDAALPEFSPASRSRWLEPRVLTSRDVLLCAAVFAATCAFFVASASPEISSASDATWVIDSGERTAGGLLLGAWPLASKVALLLPIFEPATWGHLLSALLTAGGLALAFLLLRKARFSIAAALGAVLILATTFSVWSAAVLTGPHSATAFHVILFLSCAFYFRQWIGWISLPGSFLAFIALILHLVLVAPGSDVGIPQRFVQSTAGLYSDVTLAVVVASAVGCLGLFRRARGDFWLWLALFVAACAAGDATLLAVLSLLPLACALELARDIPRARSEAGHIGQLALAVLLIATPLATHASSCWRRGDRVVADYGSAVLGALPDDAKLVAPTKPQRDVLRYLLEVKRERPDVTLDTADSALDGTISTADLDEEQNRTFIAGFTNRGGLETRTVPFGLAWKVIAPGRQTVPSGEPWDHIRFRDLSTSAPASLREAATRFNRSFLVDLAVSRSFVDEENAAVWLEVAVDLAEGSRECLALAKIVERQGLDTRLAETLYQRAHRVDPRSPAPLRGLARLAYREKDYARAKEIVAEIEETTRDDFDEIFLLAQIAEAEGETEKAIELFRRALVKAPRDYRPSRRLGLLLQRTGDREEAYRQMEKSLALFPYQPDLTMHLEAAGRRPRGQVTPGQPTRPGIAPGLPSIPGMPGIPGLPNSPGVPQPGFPRPGIPGTQPHVPGIPGLPGGMHPGVPRPGSTPGIPSPGGRAGIPGQR